MPEKFGQKLLWVVLNSVFTLAIGFLLLSTTARGDKWLSTERAIDEKADIEYVNTHDAMIQKNLDDYKDDHQIQHSAEMKSVDNRLKLMMEFWGITKE